jgi:hypothetical protein
MPPEEHCHNFVSEMQYIWYDIVYEIMADIVTDIGCRDIG